MLNQNNQNEEAEIISVVGKLQRCVASFLDVRETRDTRAHALVFPLRITRRISEVRKFAFGIAKDQRELYCGDPTSAYPANGAVKSALGHGDSREASLTETRSSSSL